MDTGIQWESGSPMLWRGGSPLFSQAIFLALEVLGHSDKPEAQTRAAGTRRCIVKGRRSHSKAKPFWGILQDLHLAREQLLRDGDQLRFPGTKTNLPSLPKGTDPRPVLPQHSSLPNPEQPQSRARQELSSPKLKSNATTPNQHRQHRHQLMPAQPTSD